MASTWIITTRSSRPIAQIAKEIDQAGCKIQNILDQMGVIIAEGDETAIARLRKMPDITDVTEDKPMTTQGR